MGASIGRRWSVGTKEEFSILPGGFLLTELGKPKYHVLPRGLGDQQEAPQTMSGKIQILGLVGPRQYYFFTLEL